MDKVVSLLVLRKVCVTSGKETARNSSDIKGYHSQAWSLMVVLLLSSYSVEGVAAAQVCTTNSDGTTVCHDKLSGGAIAAIVITIREFLGLICILNLSNQ